MKDTEHLEKIAETISENAEAGSGIFDTIINVIRNLFDMV